MCIAIAKPVGIDLPPDEHFVNSFNANRDGAGIAYAIEGKVHYLKGLMTLEKFNEALAKIGKKHDLKLLPMFFHFRIGTHGKTRDPAHTHPFPISNDLDDLERLCGESDTGVMMHNGIISSCTGNNLMSDTMVFNASYMWPLSKFGQGWQLNEGTKIILGNILNGSNKVAHLSPNGEITLFGNWPAPTDGCYYSNQSHLNSIWASAADPRLWHKPTTYYGYKDDYSTYYKPTVSKKESKKEKLYECVDRFDINLTKYWKLKEKCVSDKSIAACRYIVDYSGFNQIKAPATFYINKQSIKFSGVTRYNDTAFFIDADGTLYMADKNEPFLYAIGYVD